jgi:kynurenine formamidase
MWSGYDPVRVAEKFAIERDGFYVRSWAFDEHAGTHVDAPAHWAEGAATVDRIDVSELVLPCGACSTCASGSVGILTPSSCPTICSPGSAGTGRCPSGARSWP